MLKTQREMQMAEVSLLYKTIKVRNGSPINDLGVDYVRIDDFVKNPLTVYFIPSFILEGLGVEVTPEYMRGLEYSEDKLSKYFTKADINTIKEVSNALTVEGELLSNYGLTTDNVFSVKKKYNDTIYNIVKALSYDDTVLEAAPCLNDNALIIWESFDTKLINDVEENTKVRNSQRILFALSKFTTIKNLIKTTVFLRMLTHKVPIQIPPNSTPSNGHSTLFDLKETNNEQN